MFTPPPLLPWDSAHPVVVHFPIALLMVSPLLILLPLLWRSQARGLSLAALLVLALGTAGAMLAVATGEAAEEVAEGVAGVDRVLHEHEEAAEMARNIFLGITVLYAAFWAAPIALRKPLKRAWFLGGSIALTVLTVPGLLALANAGHLGGRLVHEFGVHALMPSGSGQPSPAAAPKSRGDDDD